jgi:hypothetical protein
MSKPTVAVFRPADERLDNAVALLTELGLDPLGDPMLAVEPTGAQPRTDADYTILTSKTGVELLDPEWSADGKLCAIGESTAAVLRSAGYAVDLVELYGTLKFADIHRDPAAVDWCLIDIVVILCGNLGQDFLPCGDTDASISTTLSKQRQCPSQTVRNVGVHCEISLFPLQDCISKVVVRDNTVPRASICGRPRTPWGKSHRLST